jgi:hypothetical protein
MKMCGETSGTFAMICVEKEVEGRERVQDFMG